MLPMNRIYTPEELRTLSRLSPVESGTPVAPRRQAVATRRGGGALLALLQRLVDRGGLRRPAPGTT